MTQENVLHKKPNPKVVEGKPNKDEKVDEMDSLNQEKK